MLDLIFVMLNGWKYIFVRLVVVFHEHHSFVIRTSSVQLLWCVGASIEVERIHSKYSTS